MPSWTLLRMIESSIQSSARWSTSTPSSPFSSIRQRRTVARTNALSVSLRPSSSTPSTLPTHVAVEQLHVRVRPDVHAAVAAADR